MDNNNSKILNVAQRAGQTALQLCSRMIPRGEIVRKVVQESGIPLTRLAQRLGVSRSQLYLDFNNPEMSFDRILAIGKLLGHDFSNDFRDLPAAIVQAVNGSSVPSYVQLQECQAKLLTVQEQLISALQLIDKYRLKYGPETAA